MADSKKSAFDFLEELREERDELNGLIRALEKRLGGPTGQSVSSPASEESISQEGRPLGRARTRDAAMTPPIGFFHNLSQAAAAEKLLKMKPGQALSTHQILEVFKDSGMTLNPKNSVQILYTALKRNPKFERVGNKAWGLREWYPEKKKRTERDGSTADNSPDMENLPDHNPIQDFAKRGHEK